MNASFVTAVVLNLNNGLSQSYKISKFFQKEGLKTGLYARFYWLYLYRFSFGKVVWCEFQRGLFLRVHVCIQRGWVGEAWIHSTLLDHQQSPFFSFNSFRWERGEAKKTQVLKINWQVEVKHLWIQISSLCAFIIFSSGLLCIL